MKLISIALVLVFIVSCQEEGDADKFLRGYVKSRFGVKSDKGKVVEHLTSPLLDSVNNLNDRDLNIFLDLTSYKFKKFRSIHKSCEKDKHCFITYEVSFDKLDGSSRDFTSEVKKIAELKKVDGKWKIADVNNIKTFHQSLKELTP